MASGEQEDKRSRILDAAEQIFALRGFHGARVTDIAKTAGVADGTIYLYFKNKDDLLVSLFEQRMSWINEIMAATVAECSDARSRFRGMVDRYLDLAVARPHLAEVLSIELRSSSKFMKEYKNVKFAEFLGLIAEVIQQGQQAGDIRDDVQPELVGRALFGALDELVVHYLMTRRRAADMAGIRAQVFSVLWSGIERRREEL